MNTSKLSTSLGASSNRNIDDLRNIINRLGFEIEADDEHDRFTFIEARKL